MRRSLKLGSLAALGLALACGDATGPGALDQAQKTALANALTASGAVAATPVAPYTALVANALQESGHISATAAAQVAADVESAISASVAAAEYDAVGVVIDFTIPISAGTTFEGAAAFVFGWNGLSTSSNSVSEFVSAGLVNVGTNSVPSGTRGIPPALEDEFALATYYESSTSSQYNATSGSVTVTTATFSGTSQNCPGAETQPTVTCTFSTGTMSGQFAFQAVKAIGTGAETYSQPQINYANLPAIRVSLTVTAQ